MVELLPDEPEALGLLALMLHAQARRSARRNQQGEFVPFADQDQSQWNWQMIEEAETLISTFSRFASVGRYQLEAALQSAHVYRCRTHQDNWAEVLQLYDTLYSLSGSPVVAVNRALAISEVRGPDEALIALDQVKSDVRLADYQPYWAARADLLSKTGANGEAHEAYEIAIGLERDPAIRRFLQQRQSQLMSDILKNGETQPTR
jgi:predicted RNA polymerase sigma factor